LVRDTGPGIPAASLSRIFDPFYRVPGATAEGTGIGLATVHRIVAAHGGKVTVDSTLGAGATFSVRLPLAEAPCDTPAPARVSD
jgi:signal transduction histidine kinase